MHTHMPLTLDDAIPSKERHTDLYKGTGSPSCDIAFVRRIAYRRY
jgi:hypothetical protein